MPTIDQLIVWGIVGLIAGGLTSRLITWDNTGFGRLRNLGLGLAGALIGGIFFRLLGLWPGLDRISISLRDIVSAIVGSLILLAALWAWRWFQSRDNTNMSTTRS